MPQTVPDRRSSVVSILGCILKPSRSPDFKKIIRWLVSFLVLRFASKYWYSELPYSWKIASFA